MKSEDEEQVLFDNHCNFLNRCQMDVELYCQWLNFYEFSKGKLLPLATKRTLEAQ
jgi:hypothetical protein